MKPIILITKQTFVPSTYFKFNITYLFHFEDINWKNQLS